MGSMKRTQQQDMESIIKDIAKKELMIETLERRKMDSLDFHEVGVLEVRAALEAAYRAGQEAAKSEAKAAKSEKAKR
jgi:hypothetical protein